MIELLHIADGLPEFKTRDWSNPITVEKQIEINCNNNKYTIKLTKERAEIIYNSDKIDLSDTYFIKSIRYRNLVGQYFPRCEEEEGFSLYIGFIGYESQENGAIGVYGKIRIVNSVIVSDESVQPMSNYSRINEDLYNYKKLYNN